MSSDSKPNPAMIEVARRAMTRFTKQKPQPKSKSKASIKLRRKTERRNKTIARRRNG